jgi:very-short-patch-repair endonuclease
MLLEQGGVLTYQQLRDGGLSAGAIRRAADSGRWRRLHRGVFHVAAGEPELPSRMWGAYLATGRTGVVGGTAAGHYWGLLTGSLPEAAPVLVLVPEAQHLTTGSLATRRVPDPLRRAHPARQPPVLTVEHTTLDLVGGATSAGHAVELILRACRMRLTTPDRIAAAMAQLARQPRRQLLREVCADVRLGVTSPLERSYRTRVVLPHGLPAGRAQVRAQSAGGPVYRDLVYDPEGVIVELDGRLGHESESDVFRDQWRDNSSVLTGRATLRFGWQAVVSQSCSAAGQVAGLLRLRGWAGYPRRCGPRCLLDVPGIAGAA